MRNRISPANYYLYNLGLVTSHVISVYKLMHVTIIHTHDLVEKSILEDFNGSKRMQDTFLYLYIFFTFEIGFS